MGSWLIRNKKWNCVFSLSKGSVNQCASCSLVGRNLHGYSNSSSRDLEFHWHIRLQVLRESWSCPAGHYNYFSVVNQATQQGMGAILSDPPSHGVSLRPGTQSLPGGRSPLILNVAPCFSHNYCGVAELTGCRPWLYSREKTFPKHTATLWEVFTARFGAAMASFFWPTLVNASRSKCIPKTCWCLSMFELSPYVGTGQDGGRRDWELSRGHAGSRDGVTDTVQSLAPAAVTKSGENLSKC